MKLENLVFQKKAGVGGHAYTYAYPNVTIRSGSSGRGVKKTVVTFRACDKLYESNTHCVYAIAGNRLYFMFCGNSVSAYKLSKPNSSHCYQINVQYNKEISKFIREKNILRNSIMSADYGILNIKKKGRKKLWQDLQQITQTNMVDREEQDTSHSKTTRMLLQFGLCMIL